MPFDTTEPGSSFRDLEILREIIGETRVVALGEATHGTSEFFTMKHRLVEFLVIELGFTIFAIEAPWPATAVINDYVQGGEERLSQILRSLTYPIWWTREVIDLIEWIRAYNSRPGVVPVSFQAFDMQATFDGRTVNQVLTFVEEVDPAATERFADHYADLPFSFSAPPEEADVEGAWAAFNDLLDHRDAYVSASSTAAFEEALHAAEIIVQSEEHNSLYPSTEKFELRDRYMAENVKWALEQAGSEAKIILWAHNVHVAASPFPYPDDPDGTTVLGMGGHLREHYGDELVAVGFDFFSGVFFALEEDPLQPPSAEGESLYRIPLPSPESTEYTFAQLGLARFMLDLRGTRAGSPAGDWLLADHPMWLIGTFYNPSRAEDSRIVGSLPEMFDVLIYIHETTASQQLT